MNSVESAGSAGSAGHMGRMNRAESELDSGSTELPAAGQSGAPSAGSSTGGKNSIGAGGAGEATDAGQASDSAQPEGPSTPSDASSSSGATDLDCDFNGIWIAKQVTVSQALELPQSSNNWYYLELQHTGNLVEVRRHFDCGIEVRGSLTVTIPRATLESLLAHNVQTGRQGTVAKQDGACQFKMARFWSIRGASEEQFLPTDGRASIESIDAVAAAKPLPSARSSAGAVDTENDGKLGVAFEVSGLGVRNSVQRDWTAWFTEPGHEIAPSVDWLDDLTVRADFDNEESVIDPPSGLLTSLSEPVGDAKHVLRLRFLGRDATDPRAQAVIKPNDAETCFAVQDALPAEQIQ